MSLSFALGRPKQHKLSNNIPAAKPRPELPAFGETIDFAPRDQRSGEVAALALRRFGVQTLLKHGYEAQTAPALVEATAQQVEQMGRDAAFIYGVKRQPKERPADKVINNERKSLAELTGFEAHALPASVNEEQYEQWADKRALVGDHAAVVLHSLDALAYGEAPRDSRFDQATAQIMLEAVDRQNPHIRI